MKNIILCSFIFFGVVNPLQRNQNCLLKSSKNLEKYTHKWDLPRTSKLPKSHDWENFNGQNFLSQIRNQFNPNSCGSCWAQAIASALSDRIAVKRSNKFPEITLSPQHLLTCDQSNQGCKGGSVLSALKFIHDGFIVDETCAPYLALGRESGLKCNNFSICKDCTEKKCWAVKKFNKYKISSFGRLPSLDVEAMKDEIFQRGPIIISGWKNFGEGDETNHLVSIVGWGEDEQGTKYWKVRNSWGEYWGEGGFFRVKRGSNSFNLESRCYWAELENTWENQLLATPDKNKKVPLESGDGEEPSKWSIWDFFEPKIDELIFKENQLKGIGVIKSPQPHDYIKDSELPKSFFWGDVNGKNYLSMNTNQRIPSYCGSCWGQAASAMLADRINIKRNNNPRVALSPQNLVNCRGGGSCIGGSMIHTLNFIYHEGIHERGCQVYQGSNPKYPFCTQEQKCKMCGLNEKDGTQECKAVKNPRVWKINEFGPVLGADQIKKEVFARGPVACLMDGSSNFIFNYKGGIYFEKNYERVFRHFVNIVGWGVDEETMTEYWIVRNSWGTHWGRSGYFYMKMFKDNLNLGKVCWWATPSLQKNY